MKNRSTKSGFTPSDEVPTNLPAGLRCGRPAGFTLVEILVAAALIVAIFSMVCASYFATSTSSQACRARIAHYQRAHRLLEQMARQIRCSYAPATKQLPYAARSISKQGKPISANIFNYFSSNPDESGEEILKFVTTNGTFARKDEAAGLFEVTYKFEKTSRTLFSSQRRFIDAPKSAVENRHWQPIARDVKCFELKFLDGQKWSDKWDFNKTGRLPRAVKINLSCEDENYRQYDYGTIAYVFCRMNQIKETPR